MSFGMWIVDFDVRKVHLENDEGIAHFYAAAGVSSCVSASNSNFN